MHYAPFDWGVQRIRYPAKVTQPGRGWDITPRQSDLRLYVLKKMYMIMSKQGYLSASLKYHLQGSPTFSDILLAWHKDVTMTTPLGNLIAFTSSREDMHISGRLLHWPHPLLSMVTFWLLPLKTSTFSPYFPDLISKNSLPSFMLWPKELHMSIVIYIII